MNVSIDTLEREVNEAMAILTAIREDMAATNKGFEQLLAQWDSEEDQREHADWEAIN